MIRREATLIFASVDSKPFEPIIILAAERIVSVSFLPNFAIILSRQEIVEQISELLDVFVIIDRALGIKPNSASMLLESPCFAIRH
jgi:hypothetical protein